MSSNLISHRSEIDKIDKEISELLKKRFAVCQHIGAEKKHSPMKNVAFSDPVREQAVLDQVVSVTHCQRSQKAILDVYQAIFSASIKLQQEV